MASIIAILEILVSFLPGSILLNAISTYANELQPFYNCMAYVNYFIPVGTLVSIFAAWGTSVIIVLVFFHFYKKL